MNSDKVSPRQLQLIQGSASILIEHLSLTKEEAISIISESLKEELKASNVLFEFLEIGSLTYRQSFARNLVYRVEKKVKARRNIPEQRIRNAIDIFVKMLYDSWLEQGGK